MVPLARWDVEQAVAGTKDETHMRFGSFLADVERSDAAAFGLSSAEALQMDPQQRLVLEAFQEAHVQASGLGLTSRCAQSILQLQSHMSQVSCRSIARAAPASTEFRWAELVIVLQGALQNQLDTSWPGSISTDHCI